MDNSRFHFLLPSKKDGYMGVSLTMEEIRIVYEMQKKYPDKYKGAEGTLQALVDYKKDNAD